MNSSYEYEYPRPAVASDLVVWNRFNNHILLIERKHPPFAGCWALPGGFIDENESVEKAAIRELKEETNLDAMELTLIGVYSEPKRDPRSWVISVAYLASVNTEQIPVAGDDAARAIWFDIEKLPQLAFDHQRIVEDAIKINT